jgi:hypothetical protein
VLQYPARRVSSFSTHITRFLDGSEQRFRVHRAPRRRWVIQLGLLDGEELAQLEGFFLSNRGQAGSFEFVDPWDDVTYPNCSLEEADMDTTWRGHREGETTVVVKQNEE